MAAVTVWKFPDPGGADLALARIETLEKQGLVEVADAAIVSWRHGAKKPKTTQVHDQTRKGALTGGFWGLLFGLIFVLPFLGAAVGVAMGALAGHFSDYGINDEFIEQVRAKVTEGTSALFVLTGHVDREALIAEMSDLNMELIQSNLTPEEEQALREAFAEED
jgi:uncharacterized membrane protein